MYQRSRIALIALGIAAFAGTAAGAQSVNDRQWRQDQRIDRGVARGQITPGEAARLDRQQSSIARQEARMRDRNGGHLSRYDRQRLAYRQDRASDNIRYKRNNWRRY